ncbi:site-specific integrase [Domibacillus indicus]|uniref:site-specific integrase n=1 Tax=Domibacillus indicus TaxID=1437523 RepID=UPI000617B21B|nr:site-specific integrase [Domibacillus indicus]
MLKLNKEEPNNVLFNEEIKNAFLEEQINKNIITVETSNSYKRIFIKTSEIEQKMGKDLNKFNKEELEAVLFQFESKSRNTIESYARIISSYLHWSLQKGLASVNVLSSFRPVDFEKYIVNKEEYITEKTLRYYEDGCVNYQDAVILRLLFTGVAGKEMSEIKNLKKQDIDGENNRLRLINTLQADQNGNPVKYTERYLSVDDRTIDLIKGALQDRIYHKRNGEINQTANNNIRPYTDLVNSDYVIRSSITNTERLNSQVDKFLIYRRVEIIREYFGIENLTAKIIQRSGMIHQAEKLIEDNQLTLHDLKIVADRFNVKSYHNLKGLLTIENIRKVYPGNRLA